MMNWRQGNDLVASFIYWLRQCTTQSQETYECTLHKVFGILVGGNKIITYL